MNTTIGLYRDLTKVKADSIRLPAFINERTIYFEILNACIPGYTAAASNSSSIRSN